MNMFSARTLKLLMLVLGVALFSEWFHLSEFSSHTVVASESQSHKTRTPASSEGPTLNASDCTAPMSHTQSPLEQDCVVHCHTHSHNCGIALLSATGLNHALSFLQAGLSSESLRVLDPHYGSLLRPPTA